MFTNVPCMRGQSPNAHKHINRKPRTETKRQVGLRVEDGDGGDVNRQRKKFGDDHQIMPCLDCQGYH